MGTNSDTFCFPPHTTLKQALFTICSAFQQTTEQTRNEVFDIEINSADFYEIATGFKAGLRAAGKTPKSRIKSLNKSFNHNAQPKPSGESYLAYMSRLAKLNGCNIKMHPSKENTILVSPPTYDRENPSPYVIEHYLDGERTRLNTVIDAKYNFGLDHQPSVVIVEVNGSNDGKFHQNTSKGIAINELTGRDKTGKILKSVELAEALLTNGKLGPNNPEAEFNEQLFRHRLSMTIDILTNLSMPHYTNSLNAANQEEALYAASMYLAEQQDKYVEMIYRVKGWTVPGPNGPVLWHSDMLVNIIDETFSPGSPKFFLMWIRRVNFIKNRGGGTVTEIVCTLPYTHNFEINDMPGNFVPTTSGKTPFTPGGGVIPAIPPNEQAWLDSLAKLNKK
jgi:hypothetical protein